MRGNIHKIVYLFFMFVLMTSTLALAATTPSFIKVGKSYQCSVPGLGGGPLVKVLAIGEDGWIKVDEQGRVYWLNTKTLLDMTEK